VWASPAARRRARRALSPPPNHHSQNANKHPTKKQTKNDSFMAQTLNAFDFSATRSQKDADLLYEAKYGERGADGDFFRVFRGF
jgi:hypothetical protein